MPQRNLKSFLPLLFASLVCHNNFPLLKYRKTKRGWRPSLCLSTKVIHFPLVRNVDQYVTGSVIQQAWGRSFVTATSITTSERPWPHSHTQSKARSHPVISGPINLIGWAVTRRCDGREGDGCVCERQRRSELFGEPRGLITALRSWSVGYLLIILFALQLHRQMLWWIGSYTVPRNVCVSSHTRPRRGADWIWLWSGVFSPSYSSNDLDLYEMCVKRKEKGFI